MNSADEREKPGSVNNARAGLKGWAYVEDWMTTLDKGMVNDFNEDINTLLTFAGLFSAVLAGFLVQLYAGLQPSNNQATNNILTQVSSQLGQISQQLVNSSVIPVNIPLPSPSFQASASVVWINTLWFLSLDLSLAAALFGMIAKQWLREYLQWTTMSGLSENQVGLRQERYEAFKDWKTPAIIASMPVLLELALILFLLGMEILLWTLNSLVFGICTIAVVLIISLVLVVTALPIFRARCPYKSPIGWAVVLARSAVFTMWNRCINSLDSFLGQFSSTDFTGQRYCLATNVENDWRAWDISRQTWSITSQEIPLNFSLAALGRYRMQVRALMWIAETSQDQRLLHAIEECVTSPTQFGDWTPFKRLIIDFRVACDYLHIAPSTLIPPCDQGDDVDDYEQGRLIDVSSVHPGPALLFTLRTDQYEEDGMLHADAPPAVCVWIAHILARDLLAVVTQNDERDVGCCGRQADYILQASVVLSGWLAYRAVYHRECPSSTTDLLVEVFTHLSYHYDKLHPRLRPLLSMLAVPLEACGRWTPSTIALTGCYMRTKVACKLTIPASSSLDAWSKADCALFAHLAQFALVEWRVMYNLDVDLQIPEWMLPPLLARMARCVSHCREQRWTDCAMNHNISDGNFLWTTRLRELFDPAYDCFCRRPLSPSIFPHALVDALKQYDDDALITASWTSRDIAALVRASEALKNQHMSEQIADDVSYPESQDDASFAEEAPSQIIVLTPSSESSHDPSSSSQIADHSSPQLVVNELPETALSSATTDNASVPIERPDCDRIEALSDHIQIVSDTAPSLSMTAAAEGVYSTPPSELVRTTASLAAEIVTPSSPASVNTHSA